MFTLGDDDEAAHLDTTTETVALHSPTELHRPEVRPQSCAGCRAGCGTDWSSGRRRTAAAAVGRAGGQQPTRTAGAPPVPLFPLATHTPACCICRASRITCALLSQAVFNLSLEDSEDDALLDWEQVPRL